VHNALAGWWRLPRAGRTLAAAGDLLDSGWIDQGYADDAQSVRCRGGARAMVERYTAALDPATEPLGVERVGGRAHRADRAVGPGRPAGRAARPGAVTGSSRSSTTRRAGGR
jgi:hypothetical protein